MTAEPASTTEETANFAVSLQRRANAEPRIEIRIGSVSATIHEKDAKLVAYAVLDRLEQSGYLDPGEAVIELATRAFKRH